MRKNVLSVQGYLGAHLFYPFVEFSWGNSGVLLEGVIEGGFGTESAIVGQRHDGIGIALRSFHQLFDLFDPIRVDVIVEVLVKGFIDHL